MARSHNGTVNQCQEARTAGKSIGRSFRPALIGSSLDAVTETTSAGVYKSALCEISISTSDKRECIRRIDPGYSLASCALIPRKHSRRQVWGKSCSGEI